MHLIHFSFLPLPRPHIHPSKSVSLPHLISMSLSCNFLLSCNPDWHSSAKSSGLSPILLYPSLAQLFPAPLLLPVWPTQNPIFTAFPSSTKQPSALAQPAMPQAAAWLSPIKAALTHTLLGSFCFSAQNKDSFSPKYPYFILMLAHMLRSLSFSLCAPNLF